ncbi:MAG TPA: hypothetical protein VGO43_10935 [Pyrinomonadaceae bacterium]|jgi:hypothetical protein|nr:hypothetical protein [Pyrinomonadaceae bacterium]
MIQTRSAKIACVAVSLVLAFGLSAFAQQAAVPDTNYDVTLQLIIGSNEPGAKSDVPANLNPITSQIKSNFNFSGYKLASTFVGRIANHGYFEYESVTTIDGKDISSAVPTFLDWSLKDLQPNANSKELQAQAFRFGARVPVAVGDATKGQGINYERMGISLTRVGLNENVPTLIGTLHLPGTSGTIFLVMTIRNATN